MYSTHRAMEEAEGFSKSWLGLGIGGGGGGGCDLQMKRSRQPVQFDLLFPPHPQIVKEEEAAAAAATASKNKAEKGARKRRLKVVASDDDDGRRQSSHGGPSPSDDDDDDDSVAGAGAGTRKKLRLTKEQSTLLEDAFHAHNILSHVQKQELARQLNLSARQVEVWFQNRRARTKLKQTEVDCEILKRCCESLTGENQRLRLELAQLQRSAAAAGGLYVHQSFPAPAPATAMAISGVCPSCCDKVTVTSGGEITSGKSSSYSS